MRFLPHITIGAAALLSAAPVWAGDFIKTTITFVAVDDNIFADGGETMPSSPQLDFRPRVGNSLFFDNYDSRDTGEQTRTYLTLYKEFDGYFQHWTPEAAMVLRVDNDRSATDSYRYEQGNSANLAGGIRDDGSYLALHYKGKNDSKLSLVLFPFDSDRFRLGYSYELSWGGRQSFVLANYVPGIRLGYETKDFYAFMGAKTARTIRFSSVDDSDETDEEEAIYAGLAGLGYDPIPDHLRLEMNGGYFQKGRIPTDRGNLQGKPMHEFGVSAQVTYWDGIKPQQSVDKSLYRNEGDEKLAARNFDPKPFGFQVSAEATYLSHMLESFEDLGETKREGGFAADLNARMQKGYWTLSADLVFRELAFLVHDSNGLYTFSTIAEELDITPEFFFDIGADYLFPSTKLVPGIVFGIQMPASATAKGIDPNTGEHYTAVTMVRKSKNVLGETNTDKIQLPTNKDISPIYSARLTLKSHLSDMVTVVGEVQLSHNANLVSNDPDEGVLEFDNPFVLGVSLMAQARF